MKKVSAIIFLILLSFCVQAQISFGPKIGFTASKLTTNADIIKTDFKNSFHYGAFARIGNRLFLQPEVVYMMKYSSFEYNLLKGIEQNIEIKTIDIPLLLGFKLFNIIRIYGGPVGSLVIDKKLSQVADHLINELPHEDDIRKLSWSTMMGAGIDILSFTLDIRYELGMDNVFNNNSASNFNTSDIKNNVFLISLGFKIY